MAEGENSAAEPRPAKYDIHVYLDEPGYGLIAVARELWPNLAEFEDGAVVWSVFSSIVEHALTYEDSADEEA